MLRHYDKMGLIGSEPVTQRIALLTDRSRCRGCESCRQPSWTRAHWARSSRAAQSAVGRLMTLPDGGPQGGYFRNRQPMAW